MICPTASGGDCDIFKNMPPQQSWISIQMLNFHPGDFYVSVSQVDFQVKVDIHQVHNSDQVL
jgi:hypothetical protein